MRRSGDPVLTAGVFVATVLLQLPFFDRWLGLLDEGYVLSIADDLQHGLVPYRDVTIDAPLPAAFYVLAGWFRLVGTSVLAARWLAVLWFAVFVTVIFRLARATLPVRSALGLVVALLAYRVLAFPHWQTFSYSPVAATLATLAALVLAGGAAQPGLGRTFVAGLFAGVAITAKQDYGVCLTGAFGLYLLALPWLQGSRRPDVKAMFARPIVFACGAVAVVVPLLGYLATQGAFGALVDQCIRFPFTAISKAQYPSLPSAWPLFAQDPALRARSGEYLPSIVATLWWGACDGCVVEHLSLGRLWTGTFVWDLGLKIFFLSPFAIAALAAAIWIARAVRERRHGIAADTAQRLLVLACAGGFLLAFNKPRDWVHLMMVYPPQLLLAAVLLHDLHARLPRVVALGLRVGCALLVGSAVAVAAALATDLRRTVSYPLPQPRAGVFADPKNGPVVAAALAWVDAQAPAGEPLLVLPTHPMLGFLSGRPTPGGYHVIWPFQGPARDARIIASLAARPATRALYSVSQWPHLGRFEDNAPQLFDAVVAGYEVEQVFSEERFGPVVLGLRQRRQITGAIGLRSLAPAVEGGAWQTWPFDEVVTHPVGRLAEPAVVRIAVRVPDDHPILRLAMGVNPEHWLDPAGGDITWVAALERDGTSRELLRRTLDPRARVDQRRWFPLDLDLTPERGREVVLALTMASEQSLPMGVAGWRAPLFLSLPPPNPDGTQVRPRGIPPATPDAPGGTGGSRAD